MRSRYPTNEPGGLCWFASVSCMEAYYNDITHDNLQLIKSLKAALACRSSCSPFFTKCSIQDEIFEMKEKALFSDCGIRIWGRRKRGRARRRPTRRRWTCSGRPAHGMTM